MEEISKLKERLAELERAQAELGQHVQDAVRLLRLAEKALEAAEPFGHCQRPITLANVQTGQSLGPCGQCDGCRLLAQLTAKLPAANESDGRYATLEGALTEIRDQQGIVCDEYEICEHPACRSSHASWAIADRALTDPEPPAR